MTKRKKVVPSRKFSTDELNKKLWLSLREDFASLLGSPGFYQEDAQNLTGKPLGVFRDGIDREIGYQSILRYKASVQLAALLKKYRFGNDVYSDEELDRRTNESYVANQVLLGRPSETKALAALVCRKARSIASEILGEYSPQDAIDHAKFGKKSSIGCPLAVAYIDCKLSNIAAFTGSSECAKWFNTKVLPFDSVLNRIVQRLPQKGRDSNMQHTHLQLVNVPKTWKVRRSITPLTLIDLFYSYGIGWQVTERLKAHGLDIRKLQDRHRHLVKKFSKSLTHATADLSAASDSITSELLNRILPRKWYTAIRKATTHQIMIGSQSYYTESVLPMGNGFTFPVETLIFYSIIKAIGTLSECNGLYSVYGDDLIYPSKLHKFVRVIFPQLKLRLNTDKTYVSFPFRESCGEDYYRGAPVRPFYQQGESADLSAIRYQSYLYKTYNGLLRRWTKHEIPQTLRMILIELTRVTDRILRIPPSYPDTAGIKVSDLKLETYDHLVPWADIKLIFAHGSRWYQFDFLHTTMKRRVIEQSEPYYWLALQSRNDTPSSQNFWDDDFTYYHTAPRPPITWRTLKRVRWYQHAGKWRKKVLQKRVPTTSSRTIEKISIKHVRVSKDPNKNTGAISDWI